MYELYTCATCIHVPKAGVKVRDNLWSQFSPRDPPQIVRLRGEAHWPLNLLTNPFSVIVESHTVAWNSGQPLISTRVLGWKVWALNHNGYSKSSKQGQAWLVYVCNPNRHSHNSSGWTQLFSFFSSLKTLLFWKDLSITFLKQAELWSSLASQPRQISEL